ncbi:MAG: SH3 domain-containing protein [Clostridia bacterium]|nr:SH3 domain-containing protein [Clostridia bacterium]
MRRFWKCILIALACVMICGSALAYNTLEKGASGSEVLRMQQALNALGYTVGTDGVFGAETQNVVKAFQRDHSLKVDGKAGNETLTLLYSLQTQQNQPAQATAAMTPAAQATATVYCADGGKLNLRSGAGTGYKAIAQIPTGTVVTLLTRGEKWCYVNYNGQTGYVMTSFLRFDSAAPTVTAPPAGETKTAVVTCDDGGKLNLRQSPESNAKILTRIPNGTVLTVTPVSSKWCAASYNGETGYVMSSFLVMVSSSATPTPSPTPAQAVTPTPSPTPAAGAYNAMVYCADGGKLNLRKTASTSAKVLTQIPTGTPLNVTRIDNTWCAATYNGQTGFVMSKFLVFSGSAVATPTPSPTPAAPSGSTGAAWVYCENGGKLNLREGAGTNYKILTQIPNNSAVTVIVRGVTWSQVSYAGVTGYVQSKFLRFDGSAAVVTPTPSPTPAPSAVGALTLHYGEFRYGIVQTDSGSLNIRKGPGTNYTRISEVRDGTLLVITAVEGDWCAVYYGDIEGYVMLQYLVVQPVSGEVEDMSQYDTSIITRVLRSGYSGEDVSLLQTRLAELNYLASVTGTYDDATVAAVRNFQSQNGLTVDGLAGSNTVALLFSAGAFSYNANTGSYSTYVMDYNGNTSSAKTAAVLKAQKALRELNYNVPLTGEFEARTHDAIVAFQLRNGITASGILDAATQTRLYSGSAHDAAWPARYYLADDAGTRIARPTNIQLLHWQNDVKNALTGYSFVTAYDPETGLSWKLSILSRGRHLDVQPTTLEDTLIQKKAFGTTSWDIHTVYILLPDGRWSMATMHNYPHGSNTIMNNGFGGQNCVHFLRDMSEAQANDPKYGVRNQETLRQSWYELTGQRVN